MTDNTMTPIKKGQTTQRVSGITFIRYAPNRKIGKPNNLKVLSLNAEIINCCPIAI
jgi:hypothetical protein